MNRSIRCRRQTEEAQIASLLAVSCIAWLRAGSGKRWAVPPNCVSVGFYRCAVPALHCSRNPLIAWSLKLIEASPVLRKVLRAEEKTFDFSAVLIQNDSRITHGCTPAFFEQSAGDASWLPLSREICQDVFVRAPRPLACHKRRVAEPSSPKASNEKET